MTDKRQSNIILLAIIGMISIVSYTNTNLYLSTLPVIADYFRVSNNAAQFSIAIFKWGLVPSLLLYGPISERIGRKLTLNLGFMLAITGAIVCYYATSINMLYLGRFIQGIGCAASACLWRALFRDLFNTKQIAKYGSHLGIIMIIPEAMVPLIGSYIYSIATWQTNFLALAIMMLAFSYIVSNYTPEPVSKHPPGNTSTIWHHYLATSKIPGFIPYTICTTCGHFAIFAWMTEAPILLIHDLGIDPIPFGNIMLAITAIAVITGNLLNMRLAPRYGSNNMIIISMIVMGVGLTTMLLAFLWQGLTLLAITIPVTIFFFGLSFLWPNTFALAFANAQNKPGYAASLYTFIQQLGGALSATVVAHMLDTHTQLGLIICLTCGLIGTIVAFLTARYLVRKAENIAAILVNP